MHYLCLKSCIEVNRPERVHFYYRHLPWGPYWDRIRDHLTLRRVERPQFVMRHRYTNTAIAHYSYAHESDFIRLNALINDGGVYADMDVLFVNPLPDALFQKPFVLGREQDFRSDRFEPARPSLCNAVIMSSHGSDFGRLWLEQSYRYFDGSWSAHACQLPEELSRAYPDWIHVEPQLSFYKHGCTVKGIRTLFEGCDPDVSGVYCMHLWAHMWGEWWRRDYTRFHEGALTEEYVLRGVTTYSLAARRFLAVRQNPDAPTDMARDVGHRVHAFDEFLTRAGLAVCGIRASLKSRLSR